MIAGFVGFGRDGEIRTLVPRGIASRRRRQAVDRVTLKPLGHVAIGASPVLTERFVGCVGDVSGAGGNEKTREGVSLAGVFGCASGI